MGPSTPPLPPPCVRGPHVILTPLRLDNVHTHFRWNNDLELNQLDSEVPFRRESFGMFLRRFERLACRPTPDAVDFEIHTHDGALIGVAYADQLGAGCRRARVSVTIAERAYRGRGLGRASLNLLLHYLFTRRGVHRVMAEAFGFNQAWRHLLATSGFRQEGCLRDYLYRDGTYWDKTIYALFDTAYAAALAHTGHLPVVIDGASDPLPLAA